MYICPYRHYVVMILLSKILASQQGVAMLAIAPHYMIEAAWWTGTLSTMPQISKIKPLV